MKNVKKVDLHIHTYASDGEWSGKQLLQRLSDKKIDIFAVCDHNTTDCLDEIYTLLEDNKQFTYIPSIEVSTTHNDIEYHILAYFVDYKNVDLQCLLKFNRDITTAYNNNILEFVSKKHTIISFDDYHNYTYNPYRGGWKMHHYFVDKGLIQGLEGYLDLLKGFNFKATRVFKKPEEVISLLKNFGATPILAHPPAYTTGDLLPIEELDYWKNAGITGFECYTRYLKDMNNVTYYIDYCNKHNLKITGGSDCHGGFAGRELGTPHVTWDMLRL